MAGNLNQLMAVHIETGVTGNFDYIVTRGFEIIQASASTNVTDAGVTNTLQTNVGGAGFVGLSAAMATDTVDDIEYANTLVEAQKTLTATDTIRSVIANSATALQADCFLWVIPTSWIAG